MSVISSLLQHLPSSGNEEGGSGEEEKAGMVAGVVVKWVPGSSLPSGKTWEKQNSEAVEVVINKSLFADERNNDEKEEE